MIADPSDQPHVDRTTVLQFVDQRHDLAGVQLEEVAQFALRWIHPAAREGQHGVRPHLEVDLGESPVGFTRGHRTRPCQQEGDLLGERGRPQTVGYSPDGLRGGGLGRQRRLPSGYLSIGGAIMPLSLTARRANNRRQFVENNH